MARQRPAGTPQPCCLHAFCALDIPTPLHMPLVPAALAALAALVELWRRRARSAKVRLDYDSAAKAREFDLEANTGKPAALPPAILTHLPRWQLLCKRDAKACTGMQRVSSCQPGSGGCSVVWLACNTSAAVVLLDWGRQGFLPGGGLPHGAAVPDSRQSHPMFKARQAGQPSGLAAREPPSAAPATAPSRAQRGPMTWF